MVEIIKTKGVGFSVVSYYVDEEKTFIICLEDDDGCVVLDKVKSIIYLVDIHDNWFKFMNGQSTSFSNSQVEKHLTIAS